MQFIASRQIVIDHGATVCLLPQTRRTRFAGLWKNPAAYPVDMSDRTFRKSGTPSQIDYEVAGLSWLAEAEGAPVVAIVDRGDSWFREPRLASTTPTRAAAIEFGQRLALTHAAGAPGFGARPPGFSGSGVIGAAHLPFPGAPMPKWGEFYSQYRIKPYLDGPFSPAQREVIQRLCQKLESGELDHPQPRLVEGAARIHGDLWAGNVIWTPQGATLIDPAAQGNHAEEDLAALALFGVPHLGAILAGYQQVSPLAPGWEERIPLHQMHLLMIHSYLFGGGYVRQTLEAAALYLPNDR